MTEPRVEHDTEAEEQARAQWYALLSRLFYAAPDRALLDGLTASARPDPEAGSSPFLTSWADLQAACRSADPEALREEFDALFVGVGKAAVTPYTAAYAASHAPDRHLLALRNTLTGWGLARSERVFEAEDHISALFDSMRWLIEQRRPLEDQRLFFDTFVSASLPFFCDAINASPSADFYRRAGDLARAFGIVEQDAFDMHTAV